jgi:hypothetical protein
MCPTCFGLPIAVETKPRGHEGLELRRLGGDLLCGGGRVFGALFDRDRGGAGEHGDEFPFRLGRFAALVEIRAEGAKHAAIGGANWT